MADRRKLLGEIDRTLKKVQEGVDVFEDIWQKVQSAPNSNAKEKHEADLKKEIKKLQRLRDYIKAWLASSEIKDKRQLLEQKKLIEVQMERFKVIERETKTKAYSKEALGAVSKVDPKEKEKEDLTNWLSQSIDDLNMQMDEYESEIEVTIGKKKKLDKEKQDQVDLLRTYLDRHRSHIDSLETIMRLVDNDVLQYSQINKIKDDVEYYINSSTEPDFQLNEYLYDDLCLAELSEALGNKLVAMSTHEADDHLSDTSDASDMGSRSLSPASGFLNTDHKEFTEDDSRTRLKSLSYESRQSNGPSLLYGTKNSQQLQSKHQTGTTSAIRNASVSLNKLPQTSDRRTSVVISQAAIVSSVLTSVTLSSPNYAQAASPRVESCVNSEKSLFCLTDSRVNVNGDLAVTGCTSVAASSVVSSLSTMTNSLTSTCTSPPSMLKAIGTALEKTVDSDGVDSLDQVSLEISANGPGSYGIQNLTLKKLSQEAVSSSIKMLVRSSNMNQLHTVPEDGSVITENGMLARDKPAIQVGSASLACAIEPDVTELKPLATTDSINLVSGSASMQPSNPLNSSSSSDVPVSRVDANNYRGPVFSLSSQLTLPVPSPQPLSQSPPTTTIRLHPMNGVAPLGPQLLDSTQRFQQEMLSAGMNHMPQLDDSERVRFYFPRNPIPMPNYYYQLPPHATDSTEFFNKLDIETLFFIFYYMEGTKSQYYAAKALKLKSWRFHTKFLMWFQRHEMPKMITDDYELGSYVYFDFEKWMERQQDSFKFEYIYLEDQYLP